jgi:hypothetical protein
MSTDYLANYKPDQLEENALQKDAHACRETYTETVDPHPVISGLISLALLIYVAASVPLAIQVGIFMGYLAIPFGDGGLVIGALGSIIIIVFFAIGIAWCTWRVYSKTNGPLVLKLVFALFAFTLFSLLPPAIFFFKMISQRISGSQS